MNATDAAVKLAAENELDLADVVGSGADGRITKGDVEARLAAREPEEAPATVGAVPNETDARAQTEPEAAEPDKPAPNEAETAAANTFADRVQAAETIQALITLGDEAEGEAERAAVRARAKELLSQ